MSRAPEVIAIIQARTGSTRLPGKVLSPILGRPMIEHQIERVKTAQRLSHIVLATSSQPENAQLLDIAKRLGVWGFAGSEHDVLDRMYQAAKQREADVVVRLTADCPLVDPALIDRFVDHFLTHRDELDYVGTGPTFAEGLDLEVMSFAALERAWSEATKTYEREHVTVYLWHSGRFRAQKLEHTPDLSRMRWTVDEERDLKLVRAVYEALFPKFGYAFGTKEILELFSQRPELASINDGIARNEGFQKSLRNERGPLVKMRTGSIACSQALWNRARGLIPAGTQTLSKGPTQYVDGVAPKYLVRGQGSHVWDVDGNEYIDYPMALGAVLLGYHYPAVVDAIQRQLEDGIVFSLMHPLEVEVAELICQLVPCAEMVRFGKNGSDATTGAIRVARAATGRDKVAHCGYHGWHDWYIGSTTRNKGVPRAAIDQQLPFRYNDLESLEVVFAQHPGEIAAVIMEPYGITLPEPGFLEGVKELAHRYGAILIFDEVASGFRFHLGGVHQRFQVDPDLVCFGKAIGNGMPISVLAGRSEVMRVLEDEVFYSFTFGGECLSLAAAKATITELREKPIIPHLWQMGTRLQMGFNRLAADFGLQQFVECVGFPPRSFTVFRNIGTTPTLIVKSLFQQEVIKRGVLFSGSHNICYSHTLQDIDGTLRVYRAALDVLAQAMASGDIRQRLEGEPVQAVFRRA